MVIDMVKVAVPMLVQLAAEGEVVVVLVEVQLMVQDLEEA